MNKNKVLAVLLSLITGIAILALVKQVNGDDQVERKIKKNIKEKGVSYTNLEISDNVLKLDFNSEGVDYCTVNDIKSIDAVYEMIQYYDYLDDCKGCDVNIYDVNGKLVYNLQLFDLRVDIERTIQNAVLDIPSAVRELSQLFSLYNMHLETTSPTTLYESEELYKIKGEIICSEDNLRRFFNDVDIGIMNNKIEEIMSQYACGMIFECEVFCNGQSKMFIHTDYKMSFLNIWIDQSMKDDFVRVNGPKS